MAVENVRLTVRDWDGTLRHERYFEHANPALWVNVPANGVECSRDGYGNCLEATWAAYAGTLGAEPRDIIEIDSLAGGVWARDFAGVLLKSGNMQATDQRSNFKLVGLKKRLQEVRVVNDVLEGDVGAQARTVLQDVIASGQLGAAIIFDAALISDTAVLLSGFKARGRRLSDLLDYFAAQAGGVWGVDADRKVYLRRRDLTGDTLALVEDAGVIIRWEDTDSEALATACNFVMGTQVDGTPFEREEVGAGVAQYGYAWKDVPLDTSLPMWTVQAVNSAYEFQADARQDSTPLDVLYDRLTPPSDPTKEVKLVRLGGLLTRVVAQQAAQRCVITYRGLGNELEITRWGYGPAGTVREPKRLFYQSKFGAVGDPVQVQEFNGTLDLVIDLLPNEFIEIRLDVQQALQGTTNAQLILSEFRVDYLSPEFFSRLADFHYRLPSADPSTITAAGRVTPHPKLSLVRSGGGTYETSIEMLTYRLTLDRDPETVIRAGQREPAEDAARRWLGQLALADATVQAVRVTS